jgi:hypothetical protein
MVTLAGLTWVGSVAFAQTGLRQVSAAGAGVGVVTVAVQVGREAAGTVAAPSRAAARSITLTAFDVPEWTVAGGRYRARFLVSNRGTVPATVVLTLATRDSQTRVEPSLVRLAPGMSAVVTVETAGTRRQGVAAIGIRATDRDAPDVHATATAETTVFGSDLP